MPVVGILIVAGLAALGYTAYETRKGFEALKDNPAPSLFAIAAIGFAAYYVMRKK